MVDSRNYDVRKLWDVELSIFKEFIRVCEKYNLKWFAIGGTLLGAVRHKGFIPWDDDIDVGMLAEDYQKFCDIAKDEFIDPYYFQYYTSEKYMTPWHVKLRKNGTTGCTIWEGKWMPESYHKGCFIDVFPLYEIPDDDIQRKQFIIRTQRAYKIISSFQLYRSQNYLKGLKFKRVIKYIYYLILISFKGGYNRACDDYIKMFNNTNKWNTVALVSVFPGNEKLEYNKEIFRSLKKLPFEDLLINVPEGYKDFLSKQYGDYMKPVKNAQYHSGLIVDVDTPFSKYDFK